MDILIERHLENVEIPANLRINDQIKIYRRRCEEMISMILAVLDGPVYIPTPSWVSYLPQARILKKEVVSILLDKAMTTKMSSRKLVL